MGNAASRASEYSGQLPLQFPTPDPNAEPLIISGPYANLRRMLDRWQKWPERQLTIIGEPDSGKTRLASQWAGEVGAAVIQGPELSDADISEISSLTVTALAIDDADKIVNGPNLLAALNLTRERKVPIMLTGACDPAAWALEPADLRSRLAAMPVIRIQALDDDAFKARMTVACKALFMKLPEETSDYLAVRVDRSHHNVARIAEALEKAASGKALTKMVAKRAIEILSDPEFRAAQTDS